MGARTMTIALATLLLVGVVAAGTSDVLVLTGKNFDTEIAKHNLVAVEFYAPWCGHCKTLQPHWDKAATQLKKQGVDVKLAKVDATEDMNKALGEQFKIQGFPTIKLFRKGGGEPIEYEGPRETEGIVDFFKKMAGPASLELKTAKDIESRLKTDEAIVVGFFPDGYKGKEFETYMSAADALRTDYAIFHASDPAVIPDDCPTVPTVIIFKNYDNKRVDSTDLETPAKVRDFVDAKTTPWVVELSQDPKNRPHLKKLFEKQALKVIGFFDADTEKGMREIFNTAAQKYDTMRFLISEAASNEQALKYFGLENDDIPAIVIHDAEKEKKYPKENIKLDEITDFIDKFQAGELQPRIKSEAEPEDNDGPVKILTANNWEKEVVKGKTYLLEFYAPWCGHCKKLAPIFDKIGSHFESRKDVVIAKMDATANDVVDARFVVKGFPTIYLLTGNGEIMPYKGDRSESDLIRFVEEFAVEADEADAAFAPERDEL